MKELLRLCPHHGIPDWQVVQSFFQGLCAKDKSLVNSSSGGMILRKSAEEAWDLIEILSEDSVIMASMNQNDRGSSSTSNSRKGVYEVESTPVINQQVAALSVKMDKLLAAQVQPSRVPSPPMTPVSAVCDLCSDIGHDTLSCPMASQYPEYVQEQVNAAQGFSNPRNDPYSNTFNQGWKSHPNLRWSQPPQRIGNQFQGSSNSY